MSGPLDPDADLASRIWAAVKYGQWGPDDIRRAMNDAPKPEPAAPLNSPPRKAAEAIRSFVAEYLGHGIDTDRVKELITEAYAPLEAELQRRREWAFNLAGTLGQSQFESRAPEDFVEEAIQQLHQRDAEDNATQFRLADELAKANIKNGQLQQINDAVRHLTNARAGERADDTVRRLLEQNGCIEQDREALRLEVGRLRDEQCGHSLRTSPNESQLFCRHKNGHEGPHENFHGIQWSNYDIGGAQRTAWAQTLCVDWRHTALGAQVEELKQRLASVPRPITPEVREKLIDELAEYLQGAIFKGEARMPKDEADRIIELLNSR